MTEAPLNTQLLNYTVRRATLADVAALAHHRACMFRDMGVIDDSAVDPLKAASQDYLSRLMANDQYLAWLIETEKIIVAGGGLLIRQLMPNPTSLGGSREAHILNVYTEPEHRRRGLARRLMTAMMSFCSEQKIMRISLHASKTGKPLYESLGFNPTNELRYEF